jgi:lysophospholipase L1-like esterase
MRSPVTPLRALAAGVAVALLTPAVAAAQTKLSGIGDSIMQGANAKLSWWPPPGDQPQFSFVRGSDSTVNSVYRRYRALGLLPLGQQVVSVDGAQMAGGTNSAPAQALRVCGQTVKADRIVIELGGNDVCSRSSLSTLRSAETFGAALTQALDILASPSCGLPPGTKVHVLTMPAVNYLYSAGVDKQWSTGTPCQLIWYAANICPVVTMSSSADRAIVAQRIDEYNAAIAAAVAAAQAAYAPAVQFSTDYTGSMDNAPNTSVGTYRFMARDISDIDCFHPKWSTGQKKLACAAWESWESSLLGGTGNDAACFAQ